jgi:hypothetical protein
MNIETTAIVAGITSLIVCITLFAIYSSFGPDAKKLIDPFEEDED